MMFRHSSGTRELNDSTQPLRQGSPGRDERQSDPIAGPVGHRRAGQLGAVVAARHRRVSTSQGEAVQLVDEDIGGDRPGDEATEAFAGVLVVDRHDFDRAAVGGGVELDVDCPDPVRGPRRGGRAVPVRWRRGRGTRSPSSRHNRWIFLWFTSQPSPRASQYGCGNPAADGRGPTAAATPAARRPGRPAWSTSGHATASIAAGR